MTLTTPYPSLDTLIDLVGQAGQRMAEIGASEGAAGNISLYIGWPLAESQRFPKIETVPLPQAAPELAGHAFLVTGSGRRLREIRTDPEGNLGLLVVDPGGRTAQLHTSPCRLFGRLTSEFNSHLAVHLDQVRRTGTNFQALVHAQPVHLTYLSHNPAYQLPAYLNNHLYRWQPETIMALPEGVGIVPFAPPGSASLQADTVAAMRRHRLVIWARHGVMARSDTSIKRACDTIEYAETAAHYEYLNLASRDPAGGLSVAEILAICEAYQIEQTLFS